MSLSLYDKQPYVPIGRKATPEKGWQPTLSEKQVKDYIALYQKSPQSLSPQKIDELQKHAVQYNIPFFTGDFDIMGAISEFGKRCFNKILSIVSLVIPANPAIKSGKA